MAAATNNNNNNSSTTSQSVAMVESSGSTAKDVHKRYEGLVMVRTKAIKGKGAWYWTHLEPILVHHTDTGLPKAVKLKCSFCDALFSASNPSRTASEHLKRGTCPNFNSFPKPISDSAPPPHPLHNNRKRNTSPSSYLVPPLSIVDPLSSYPVEQHLMLSGGKEDLGALAMLEESVKKLKSPKTLVGPALSKSQIDSAFDYLSDWVYESCGSVSFSSLEHPKFVAFLNQVGLPAISRRDFTGARLDAKFEGAKAVSEARIRDAMFFQLACDGWKGKDNFVNLTVNLPNGTTLYQRAVFVSGYVPSKYAEEVLLETIGSICGRAFHQCVGIVADKFKSKALRSLENQHHWMVNISCQVQGLNSLIKDFIKDLPLFKTVIENCLKLANLVDSKNHIRNSFHKYQLQEYGLAGSLRVPLAKNEKLQLGPVCTMLEDVLNSARSFQLVLLDESYKMESMEDPCAREAAELIRDMGFWNDLEAVLSLIKLIKEAAQDIGNERPLLGRCLPLWDEVRAKVKDWCSQFHVAEGPVQKVTERRFKKNYHPAWAAAFILDPLYLVRDTSGKYLPPFKCLTPEQEKDVDKFITRLVSREEAHIALMELMKWRTEGLDPVYARAVQIKERDPVTGKLKIVNPQSSRLMWETYLTEFKSLGRVAVRLMFMHATSCGFKCNFSSLRWLPTHGHSRELVDRAQKLIFIAAHSKLERRDYFTDEDNDARPFTLANGEDDVLNEVLIDTSSTHWLKDSTKHKKRLCDL